MKHLTVEELLVLILIFYFCEKTNMEKVDQYVSKNNVEMRTSKEWHINSPPSTVNSNKIAFANSPEEVLSSFSKEGKRRESNSLLGNTDMIATQKFLTPPRRVSYDSQRRLDERRKKSKNRKSLYAAWVESKQWGVFITLVTLYALFGDDLRLLAYTKESDPVFYAMSFIALVIFVIEIFVSVYARKDYLWGFIFWLDVISTLSLIPDIAWLWIPLLQSLGDDTSGTEENNDMLNASRATRAGTRATRMLRIVRLVRMVRIVKLFKHYRLWLNESRIIRGWSQENSDDRLPTRHSRDLYLGNEESKYSNDEPSKIGKKLLASTSKRIITLVLLIIVFLPSFDTEYSVSENEYHEYGLTNLHRMSQDYNYSKQLQETDVKNLVTDYARYTGNLIYLESCEKNCPHTWGRQTINKWLKEMRFQPINEGGHVDRTAPFTLTTNPVTGWNFDSIYSNYENIEKDLRNGELTRVTVTGCFIPCINNQSIIDPWNHGVDNFCAVDTSNYKSPYGIVSSRYHGCVSRAYFDNRVESKLMAGLSIIKTLCVMFILGGGIIMFHRDANNNVVGPIERMTSIVNQLAKDPLAIPQLNEQSSNADTGYETEIIEQTLNKVGALMRVGFGAAGSEIIRQNLSTGKFEPIVPGKKITACYMFCDIRKFTDTTECLQEEVMVYVNKIGELVHDIAVNYYGMANKNVGDAFLLSWKLQDGEIPGFSSYNDGSDDIGRGILKNITCPPHAGGGTRKRELTTIEMADSVLAATVKSCNDLIIANMSGNLSKYRTQESVRERFGPNFRVQMGFGVHCGWCIEGAIGSKYKIDCTYLSPHVDMADRLEASSKIFNTPICISHWLVGLLSPQARKHLRIVDRVTVPGLLKEDGEGGSVKLPMTIYTFDITDPVLNFLDPQYQEDLNHHKNSSSRLQLPIKWGATDVMRQIDDARRSIPTSFYKKYNAGVEDYLNGNWTKAKDLLLEASKIYPGDGPTRQLLKYMKSENYNAPSNWKETYHSIDNF